MPLEAPNLDDRTFDDLYREARLRILRYTPEWTDVNDSDPGATLLQLASWLTESVIHRLNQVPDRNYIKFLQLLGMELQPALPAETHLVFTAISGTRPGLIPKGTQVAGQPAGDGDPIIFETEADLQPVAMPLADVLVFDGAAFQPALTALNEESGTPFRPLGWVPQPGAAVYLGFEPPDPLPTTLQVFPSEIRLRCFLPTAATAGEPVRCGDLPPAPPVDLVWEYKQFQESNRWRPLNLLDDASAAFTQDGDILIAGPIERGDRLQPFKVDKSDKRYWIRCRLRSGAYAVGAPPEIDFIRVNAVRAVSLTTVRNEVLGLADGLPDFKISLRHRPVEPESLILHVGGEVSADRGQDDIQATSDDNTNKPWARVDDLLTSGLDEHSYTLNATRGEITFGDGKHGLIPPAGVEITARSYRYGGGDAANLLAGAIATPMTALVGIEAVTNPRPAVGGRDEGTVAELKRQAPARLRHRSRAISPEDFAALAAAAGGVERAHAIALAHPDHPGVEVPGAVTVVVVPDRGESPRVPSAELLRSVCRYLDAHRLLTTEVYVQKPTYLPIEVQARLIVRRYAAPDKVERDVAKKLDEYLDPLARGFGEDLYPTRLIDVILNVSDVVAVDSLGLVIDGQPARRDLQEKIIVPSDALVYGRNHQLTSLRAKDD